MPDNPLDQDDQSITFPDADALEIARNGLVVIRALATGGEGDPSDRLNRIATVADTLHNLPRFPKSAIIETLASIAQEVRAAMESTVRVTAIAESMREQADWRDGVAAEFPNDHRNVEAAQTLRKWADWLEANVTDGHEQVLRISALVDPLSFFTENDGSMTFNRPTNDGGQWVRGLWFSHWPPFETALKELAEQCEADVAEYLEG